MKAKNILLTASLCAGIGLATLVAQTGDQQQQPTPTSSPMNMMGMMNMTPAQCMAMMKQAGKSTGTIMHCAMMGRLSRDDVPLDEPIARSRIKTQPDGHDKLNFFMRVLIPAGTICL